MNEKKYLFVLVFLLSFSMIGTAYGTFTNYASPDSLVEGDVLTIADDDADEVFTIGANNTVSKVGGFLGDTIFTGTYTYTKTGGTTARFTADLEGSDYYYIVLRFNSASDGSADKSLYYDADTAAPFHTESTTFTKTFQSPDNYTMGSEDTLQVELSGSGYGEFNAINIDGIATLDGTLEVTLGNGYMPSPGDSFTFITASTITGQFNNIILPDIGSNSFEVSINDGFAVIMVTSLDTEVTPLPVIVNTNVEGTLDSLTLDVEVSLNADFANNATSTERTVRANSAIFDVFVGALVPSGAVVSEPTWFLLDSANAWGQLSGFPLAKFMGNVEVNSQDHRIVLHILNSANVRPFVGASIFIGYGTSDTEMLETGRYRSIFVVEEEQ